MNDLRLSIPAANSFVFASSGTDSIYIQGSNNTLNANLGEGEGSVDISGINNNVTVLGGVNDEILTVTADSNSINFDAGLTGTPAAKYF